MANWETFSVNEVISKISDNCLVLPVIQRRLVWTEEKMELLFDTLLKGNSFGGIIVIEEEKGSKPLFSFRYFTKDGLDLKSQQTDILDQTQCFVIDGQQRLQTFYIGLMGSLNGKALYFDLFSDYSNLEFDFKFGNEKSKLPKVCNEREDDAIKECCWYSVNSLFNRLKKTNDSDQVEEEIIKQLNIQDEKKEKLISKNIRAFDKSIFAAKNIGISKVNVNKSLDESGNRQRIVELFRRLNDGGTTLDAFDLVASILKGFEWKMEEFLDNILKDYQDIGISQDNLIKFIFILRDNHAKEMSDIEADDATFAIENSKRISNTFKALRKFLIASKLENYYKIKGRSFIPLFFIGYNIFYKNVKTEDLEDLFENYDINNADFRNMYMWMYKSLLNGVFKSKGAGWIPYKTGVRKILNVVKEFKGKDFPVNEIFAEYKIHPVLFTETFEKEDLETLDANLVYYIIYDREQSIRQNDIDHIHPKNILEGMGYYQYEVNNIANFQLIDIGTNRGTKNGKSFKEWISNEVQNKDFYLRRHLIPQNEVCWEPKYFNMFLEERKELILGKINDILK